MGENNGMEGRRRRGRGRRSGPDAARSTENLAPQISDIRTRQRARYNFFMAQRPGATLPPAMRAENERQAKEHINSFANDLAWAMTTARALRVQSNVKLAPDAVEALRGKSEINQREFGRLARALLVLLEGIENKQKTTAAPRKRSMVRLDRSPRQREGREAPAIPAGEWKFIVGEVREIVETDTTIKQIVIGRGPEAEVFNENQIPELKHEEAGNLVVIERKTGSTNQPTIEDRLGKAGSLAAEQRRLAYEIGCGRKFPKPVRDEIKMWEDADHGEKMIADEISRVGGEKALINPTEPNWREEYKHGEKRVRFKNAYTMDPFSANDYDDAFNVDHDVEINEKKYTQICIHVADVSHFLSMKRGELGYETFHEAMRRQYTAYFQNEAFHMLPDILSSKLCSLNPNVDRLTFSTVYYVDDNGNIDDTLTWQGKGVMCSEERLTYEKGQELLTADTSADPKIAKIQDTLRELSKHGGKLREKRAERGAVDVEGRDETEIRYTPTGEIASIGFKEELETNKLIADFAIQTNEEAAKMLDERNKGSGGTFPALFRAHDAPLLKDAPEGQKDLRQIAKAFGAKDIVVEIEAYTLPTGPQAAQEHGTFVGKISQALLKYAKEQMDLSPRKKGAVRSDLARAKKRGDTHELIGASDAETDSKLKEHLNYLLEIERGRLINDLRRLAERARMTDKLERHHGLAAEKYTWSTSPIRRFVDIMVHFLLNEILLNRNVTVFNAASLDEIRKMVDQANYMQQQIRTASRRSWQMWSAKQLESNVGKEIEVYVQGFSGPEFKGKGKRVYTEIRLPGTNHPVSFPVHERNFLGLPPSAEKRNVHARLRSVDIRRGTVYLEYIPADVSKEEPTVPIAPEKVVRVRGNLLRDLTQLEQTFEKDIATSPEVAGEIAELRQNIEAMSEKTTQQEATEWGRDIGGLTVRLLWASDDVEELLPADIIVPSEPEPEDETAGDEEDDEDVEKAELIESLKLLRREQEELRRRLAIARGEK